MKKSNQLSKFDTCKHGASLQLSSVSPGVIRAGCVKSLTKRLLLGEPVPDIQTELASLFSAKRYTWENNTQKNENLKKYAEAIERFVNSDYVSDGQIMYLDGVDTTVSVFGEDVEAVPDFVKVYDDDTVGICKLSTGSLKAFDAYNTEDYALGLLGEKLFPDKTVFVEHVALDINKERSIPRDTSFLFDVSSKYMYEKAHEEVLEKGEHECSAMACASCPKNNICHFEEPAIAMQVATAVRPIEIERLTNAQRQVIDYETGIARVNAGPGAGKTAVLAARVAALLEKGYETKDFCLLTFTRAGAQEMTARVMSYAAEKGIAINPDELASGTINGFCQVIVEDHYAELGFTKKPRIVPDQIKYKVIQDIVGNRLPRVSIWNYGFCQDMRRFNPYARNVAINEAFHIFDKIKSGDITRDNIKQQYSRSLKQEDIDTIFTAYDLYGQELTKRNLMEFTDQLDFTMKLLEMHPDLFEQMGYKHIIIDEFQDTDLPQIKLLQQMIDTGCFRSFMAIGDDSQSIFGFRHTSPEYMINFDQYFGEHFDDFSLTTNHRSDKAIVDFANKVNDLANMKVAKELIPTKQEGLMPRVSGYYTHKQEYKAIVDDIKRKWEAGERDIAIIAPTKAELKEFASLLTQADIPSTLMCPLPYMENSRVAALTTFYDSFFNGSTQGFADYKNVLAHGAFKNIDPDIIMQEADKFSQDISETKRNLKNFVNFAKALDPDEVDACYQDFISQLEFCETTQELCEYMDAFKLYGQSAEFSRKGRYEGVSLNTIHSSKGLEWDITYLTLSKFDKKSYHSSSFRRSGEHDEAIRKWFVGSTRAKKELIVTGEYLIAKPNARDGAQFNQYLLKAYEMTDKVPGYNYMSYKAQIDEENAQAAQEAINNALSFANITPASRQQILEKQDMQEEQEEQI